METITFVGKNTLSYQLNMIEEFPLLENTTYLNTAYVGLMSKSLIQHRRQLDEQYLVQGDYYKRGEQEILEECHHSISNFIGSSPEHTFFIPNFSSGIRLALSCIPKDFRFLVLEEDYPSLTTAIEERGFSTTHIPISATVEETIEKTVNTQQIDVLALSIVQYTSGLLIDFEALKRLKANHPNLLILGDGTQFIGGLPFNFQTAPFDLIVGSGYKWLLAGFANGFLAFSDFFLDRTNTTKAVFYEKFFTGHINILGASSLTFAINRLNQWGFSELLEKKAALSTKLRKELNRLELLDARLNMRTSHSSIYPIAGGKQRYEYLLSNEIRCKQRGNHIRVSLHFYNSEADIEKLVTVLENEPRF